MSIDFGGYKHNYERCMKYLQTKYLQIGGG